MKEIALLEEHIGQRRSLMEQASSQVDFSTVVGSELAECRLISAFNDQGRAAAGEAGSSNLHPLWIFPKATTILWKPKQERLVALPMKYILGVVPLGQIQCA